MTKENELKTNTAVESTDIESTEAAATRRALFMTAGLGLMGAALAVKPDEAHALAGEENVTLGAILVQVKEGIKQAKALKKEYYDEHIKVAVDSYKEARNTASTIIETADAVQKEKNALETGVGAIVDQSKLALGQNDQLKLLTEIINALEPIEKKHSVLDKEHEKIALHLKPEQAQAVTGKRRVYALITESRIQSVTSEKKLDEIYKREKLAVSQVDISRASKVDRVHSANGIKLSSISDKLDEVVRLMAKNNDLLEAQLQYMTTKDIDSRYGASARVENAAKSKVQSAGTGNWGNKSISADSKGTKGQSNGRS